MSTAEQARLAGFRFTKRRTEYQLRRWAAKRAVAEALGLPDHLASMASIEVLNRWSGAPFVQVGGVALPIDLSLTDRAGWAVCVIDEDPPAALPAGRAGDGPPAGRSDAPTPGTVGIDLELVEPRSRAFAEDFLTAAEQEYVAGQPDAGARHTAANLLWSAKESALKVLQVGLRADTRTVEVTVHRGPPRQGWAPLEVAAVDGRRFAGWWRREGVFLLTIAFAEPAPPPDLLPGSADLATAQPVHSWLSRPLAP